MVTVYLYSIILGVQGNSNGGGSDGSADSEESQPLTWKNAKDDPEKLAELAGLEFSIDRWGNYHFKDNEHDLDLRIESEVLEQHLSDGTLNRFVRTYTEIPEINKYATPEIILYQNDSTDTLGSHAYAVSGSGLHGVGIATSAFMKYSANSLKRTMLHETNHALDYVRGGKSSFGGISNSKKFQEALKKDGDVTKYSRKYVKYKYENGGKNNDYFLESYAEAASIVQMEQLGFGSEKIQKPNGELISINQWCKDNPNLYKVVSQELKNSSPQKFKKKNNVSGSPVRSFLKDKFR